MSSPSIQIPASLRSSTRCRAISSEQEAARPSEPGWTRSTNNGFWPSRLRTSSGRSRRTPHVHLDEDGIMILGKMFTAIRAFFNGIANAMWERNPIAIMQLEYDKSVEQLQEGRKGLELYRGLEIGRASCRERV